MAYVIISSLVKKAYSSPHEKKTQRKYMANFGYLRISARSLPNLQVTRRRVDKIKNERTRLIMEG